MRSADRGRSRSPRRRWYRACVAAWVLGLLGVLVAGVTHAGVASIVCTRDNTLFQDAQGDTSNGSGPACFAGNNGQNLTRRALVRFDLAGALPAGIAIDRVELTLEVSSAPDTVTRWVWLHRALADWGEGASSSSGGGGAPARPGDATWLHTRFPDLYWSAPGGDFVPSSSAATPVGDVDTYLWSSPAMRADVQLWLDEPATNFGWLLRGEEDIPRSVRRFDSRETDAPSRRPTLTVFYSEPVPSRPTTWARLKALYR